MADATCASDRPSAIRGVTSARVARRGLPAQPSGHHQQVARLAARAQHRPLGPAQRGDRDHQLICPGEVAADQRHAVIGDAGGERGHILEPVRDTEGGQHADRHRAHRRHVGEVGRRRPPADRVNASLRPRSKWTPSTSMSPASTSPPGSTAASSPMPTATSRSASIISSSDSICANVSWQHLFRLRLYQPARGYLSAAGIPQATRRPPETGGLFLWEDR